MKSDIANVLKINGSYDEVLMVRKYISSMNHDCDNMQTEGLSFQYIMPTPNLNENELYEWLKYNWNTPMDADDEYILYMNSFDTFHFYSTRYSFNGGVENIMLSLKSIFPNVNYEYSYAYIDEGEVNVLGGFKVIDNVVYDIDMNDETPFINYVDEYNLNERYDIYYEGDDRIYNIFRDYSGRM